jgi:hypothetical protein
MKSFKTGLLITFILILSSCSTTKTTKSIARDGSSFEKAIIVSSISEEYKYVRAVCVNCKLQGQFLLFNKKKPYDKLTFKKSNDEDISYYFDISKFFEK